MKIGVFCGVVLMVAAGCSSSGASGVDWPNYAESLKGQLDALEAAGDCGALQTAFDTADQNDDVQRDRVGEGNAGLMAYIDAALKRADCY